MGFFPAKHFFEVCRKSCLFCSWLQSLDESSDLGRLRITCIDEDQESKSDFYAAIKVTCWIQLSQYSYHSNIGTIGTFIPKPQAQSTLTVVFVKQWEMHDGWSIFSSEDVAA